MSYDDLRRIMLEDCAFMNSIRVSIRERDIVQFIKNKGKVFTSDIAEQFSISIPGASSALKKLYAKGYLTRTQLTHETGGIEYEYRSKLYKYPVKTIGNTPASNVSALKDITLSPQTIIELRELLSKLK